jgi:hypothetical protein
MTAEKLDMSTQSWESQREYQPAFPKAQRNTSEVVSVHSPHRH